MEYIVIKFITSCSTYVRGSVVNLPLEQEEQYILRGKAVRTNMVAERVKKPATAYVVTTTGIICKDGKCSSKGL